MEGGGISEEGREKEPKVRIVKTRGNGIPY